MQQCPLCEGINNCLMATQGASDNQGCWCANEALPETEAERLAELPTPARCICKACLEAARMAATHAG